MNTGDDIHVLHVDDEPDFADLAGTFLARENDRITVKTATSASDGLDCLADTDFDCIVSDYDMPGMDGIDFLKAVREEDSDLPFILFTGKGSEEVASEAISAGVTDYLQKGSGSDRYKLLANRITNAVSKHHAQQVATETQQRLQELTEATNDILWVFSGDWNDLLFINSAYEDMWGRSTDTLADQPQDLLHGVHPDDREQVKDAMERLSNGGAVNLEFRVNADEDYQRWVWAQGAPLTDDDGTVSRVAGFVRDITDRKERERELLRSEAIIDAIGDPVYAVDADRKLEYVNDQYLELKGIDREEVRGTHTDRWANEEILARIDELNQQLEAGEGDVATLEYESRTASGETIPIENRFTAVEFPDGERGRVGVLRDISDRKARETELQTQRDRYQSLFEHNPLIIWEHDFSAAVEYLHSITSDVADVESYLLEHPEEIKELMNHVEGIDVNQNAVEHYEAPSKAVLLDNLGRILTDDTIDVLAAQWAAIARGETEFRSETVGQTFSGTTTEELMHLHVPEKYADDYARVYVTGIDITERKERERKLKRQNEQLEQFAHVVSHDIRTPLQVAHGRLAVARETGNEAAFEDVRDALNRIEAITDDVLTLAKEGRELGETSSVDLDAIARDAWQTAGTGPVTLKTNGGYQIDADQDRLRQLFENLFTNAAEHAGPEVTVSVGPIEPVQTTTRSGSGAPTGFYIEDNGPGIPADEREDVFEAGYSTSADGTGFGLSIVKQVVDAHGWDIRVSNGNTGGARFEITGVEFVE